MIQIRVPTKIPTARAIMIGTTNSPPFMYFIEMSFYLVKVGLFSNVNYFMNKEDYIRWKIKPSRSWVVGSKVFTFERNV